MGNSLSCKLSGISLFLALQLSTELIAQTWQLVDSVPFQPPKSISQDQSGRLYLANAQGVIFQYTEQRDSLRSYQPFSQEPPTLLSWQMLRTQAYLPLEQTLVILDQNLNEVSNYQIAETVLGNVTLSADQHLWYINSELVLKKFQPLIEQTVISASLQWYISSPSNIQKIKEYQNRLYILTEVEVLVLDLFGNFLARWPISSDSEVRFKQNELYYLTDNKITFRDLYSDSSRQLPGPVLLTPDTFILGSKFMHVFCNSQWYRYTGETTP